MALDASNSSNLEQLALKGLTSPTEGSHGDDLRNILHGGQRMAKVYKMAKKYCRKFQPREYGAQTLQTICDSKDPNVT